MPLNNVQKSANFDAFLKLDNVKGESQDDKHKDEIELLSWSWNVQNQGAGHYGSGSGAGKVAVGDMHIIKRIDKASPTLFKSVCTGDHIGNGTLTVRKAGGQNAIEYLKIELSDIFVSSLETSTHEDHPLILEEVSLNFTKFKISYTPQTKSGGSGATGDFGWDIGKNKTV
ncbi:MAG TPA: type VI secretion system tube protein Hcp [Micropepsaceae bacterium]|nr:type VI secretion system tube protein Hcp [Micropepsaceae bacterium]